MLRKVRREGLTGEQLAALGGSSRLDDSEARSSADEPARADGGVKAKIDEIEQQMVGDALRGRTRAAARILQRPRPQPAPIDSSGREHGAGTPSSTTRAAGASPTPPAEPARRVAPAGAGRGDARPAPPRQSPALDSTPASFADPLRASKSAEVAHDPELDEAVIAFANADFEQCEQALRDADRHRAARARSTPRPGWCCSTCTAPPASSTSSRAWRSTTRSSSAGRRRSGSRCRELVAEAASEERPSARRGVDGEVGWVCPEHLDAEASPARLRSRCRCRCPGCSTGASLKASTPRPAPG